MTREEIKELLPIMQAFAEGKSIQMRTENRPWFDVLDDKLEIGKIFEYRIKPEEQSTVILYLKIKGRHCLREFPINQKNTLICNGWKTLTQQEAIDLLFRKETSNA